MKIDLPNLIKEEKTVPTCPSKYMLYSDYFKGFLDYMVIPGAEKKYLEFSKELDEVSKKTRRYGYLFKTAKELCTYLQ